jgi:hypothetical protein
VRVARNQLVVMALDAPDLSYSADHG